MWVPAEVVGRDLPDEGRDVMLKLWEEHGRWKTECRFSSSGDTWIGFCKLCTVDCPLAGKNEAEIVALAGDAA